MNHRKSKHLENVAYCRNNIEGKCTYADNMCWWNHNEEQNESIKCFICGKYFESRMSMMKHRKLEHIKSVKTCTQFQQNNCRFKNEACWFSHEVEYDNTGDKIHEPSEGNKKDNFEKVFQEVSEDLDPPLVNPNQSPKKHQKENLSK